MFQKLKEIPLKSIVITSIFFIIFIGVSISVVIEKNRETQIIMESVDIDKQEEVKEKVKKAWESAEEYYYAVWAQKSSIKKEELVNEKNLNKYLKNFDEDKSQLIVELPTKKRNTYIVKYELLDSEDKYLFEFDKNGKIIREETLVF